MKLLYITLLFIVASLVIALGFIVISESKPVRVKQYSSSPCRFYDGEGNEIPLPAVKALVRSQFVQVDDKEDSLIKEYFYFLD